MEMPLDFSRGQSTKEHSDEKPQING